MLVHEMNKVRQAFVTPEGFFLSQLRNTITLSKHSKVYHMWKSHEFSYYELILSIYAALVEPPLLSN